MKLKHFKCCQVWERVRHWYCRSKCGKNFPQIFCVFLITTEIASPLIPVIYPIHLYLKVHKYTTSLTLAFVLRFVFCSRNPSLWYTFASTNHRPIPTCCLQHIFVCKAASFFSGIGTNYAKWYVFGISMPFLVFYNVHVYQSMLENLLLQSKKLHGAYLLEESEFLEFPLSGMAHFP